MAVIMSRQIVVPKKPINGILASDLEEGSIVLLPENNKNVEFYVAKHDYESGLNGAGRTLLVRKDCHSNQVFQASGRPGFMKSELCTWLNGTYKNLFPDSIKTLMGSTKFYCATQGSQGTIAEPSCSVFLLSYAELGGTSSDDHLEGTALPTENEIAYSTLDGTGSGLYWLRTPTKTSTIYVRMFHSVDDWTGGGYFGNEMGDEPMLVRPCFTIPANTVFDPDTKEFSGVA